MEQGIGQVSFDGSVYRATFQRSYRHTAQRLFSAGGEPRFASEADAIRAIESRAGIDAVEHGAVFAGSYTRGTRKAGEVISRW